MLKNTCKVIRRDLTDEIEERKREITELGKSVQKYQTAQEKKNQSTNDKFIQLDKKIETNVSELQTKLISTVTPPIPQVTVALPQTINLGNIDDIKDWCEKGGRVLGFLPDV